MKSKNLLNFIFFLIVFQSFGQQKQTVVIEFKKDDHSLLKKEQTKLDSVIRSLQDFNLESVELTGHTDSDASNAYNIDLSKRRNQSVVDFLVTHGISKDLIQTQFFGEEKPKDVNTTKTGQQRNRRVELLITYSPPLVKTVEIEEVVEQKEDCTQDTIIQLFRGSLLKMNKCAYLRNPNCVKIKEFLDAESLRQEGLETMTEDGQELISGGMLKYEICKDYQVQVYMPVPISCDDFDDMDLWERNEDGSWKKISRSPLKITTINNVRYYPLSLSGNGFINVDKLAQRINLNKVKIKVKKGIELNRAIISCGCPLYGTGAGPKNKRKRKIILGTLCCPDPMITVSANTKSGEQLVINYQPLSKLKKATNRGYCRTTIKKKWWFFKVWNKQMYRKYKLKREDFKTVS